MSTSPASTMSSHQRPTDPRPALGTTSPGAVDDGYRAANRRTGSIAAPRRYPRACRAIQCRPYSSAAAHTLPSNSRSDGHRRPEYREHSTRT
ncbi:hypothetical protein [Kitasatospora sp. SUK 42]|uniref:hypothetical protein n=1 Tax=Kitasatospora sp. SUK 42 TaxID=1588882 RepID=UPI001C318BE5|nr:hypothetical protein [Kitasatospora sp. SUK 42]MBV2156472.1 hypothetical protein [Kitasatospora sp. SUK 42]